MTVCFAYNLAMPESEGTLDVIDRIVRAASDAAAHRDSAREHTTAALAVNERLITRSGEAIACSRERLAGAPLSTARQMEFRHLKIAEVHVGLARILIRRQRNLIDRLSARGISTNLAEMVLNTMQITLAAMEGHRTYMRQCAGIGDTFE